MYDEALPRDPADVEGRRPTATRARTSRCRPATCCRSRGRSRIRRSGSRAAARRPSRRPDGSDSGALCFQPGLAEGFRAAHQDVQERDPERRAGRRLRERQRRLRLAARLPRGPQEGARRWRSTWAAAATRASSSATSTRSRSPPQVPDWPKLIPDPTPEQLEERIATGQRIVGDSGRVRERRPEVRRRRLRPARLRHPRRPRCRRRRARQHVRALRHAGDPALRYGSRALDDALPRGARSPGSAQAAALMARDGRRRRRSSRRDASSTACSSRSPRSRRYSRSRGRRSAGTTELVRVAKACDRAGFFYIAACDHVVRPALARGRDVDGLVRRGRDARLPRGRDQARAAHVVRVDPRVPPSAPHGEGVHDARRALRRPRRSSAAEPATSRPSSPPWRRLRAAAKLMDEALDAITAAFLDEYPTHDGAAWRVPRRRPPAAAGPAAAPADLDRRQHAGRAQARGREGRRLGRRRERSAISFRPRSRRSASIVGSVRGDDPIEIGANSPWLYLGEAPDGDAGRQLSRDRPTGSPRRSASSKAMGANLCGVRFRSRSCDERCDQIEAFGREVAPLLNA